MKNKGINYFIKTLILAGAVILTFFSCKNKSHKEPVLTPEGTIEFSVKNSDEQYTGSAPLWHAEEGVIFVLFGYGFNSDAFYSDAMQKLKDTFGLTEDNGLIQAVRYPEDVRNRIMNMYDTVNEEHVKGIILLGAPENTHFMLAKLQDEWDAVPPYSVFSFFPQDDILGQEATCDFVLDYAQSAEDESVNEETEQSVDAEAETLLLNAVRYMAALPGPLPPDTDLHTHVQTIAGKRKVHRYTDSETGLQSINHFVLEQPER